MKRFISNLYKNSLFRNSLYQMLGTAVMAGLGFFFWLFVAHLFSDEEVGFAAALISIITTLAGFSLIGFDTSTIRFLAHSTDKNATMNTGMTVVTTAAFFLSMLFIFLIGYISPQLAHLFEKPIMAVVFVIFAVLSAVNTFNSAIFLSFRETKYTFYVNSVFSVAKVGFPFLFIGYGAFGIFASATIAQAIGYTFSLSVLIRKYSFRPKLVLSKKVIKDVWRYSAGNYFADSLNFLPIALLPIFITNFLGVEQVAYYYIVTMIISLLNVIPASAMRSLFAEGSFDETSIPKNIKEAIKTTSLFLFPAIIVLLLGGKYVLSLFGAQYVESGIMFLNIMAVLGMFAGIFMLYGSIFRLTNNIVPLIVRNAVFTGTLILCTYLFIQKGLLGIGLAYVTAYTSSIITCLVIYKHEYSFTFINTKKNLLSR